MSSAVSALLLAYCRHRARGRNAQDAEPEREPQVFVIESLPNRLVIWNERRSRGDDLFRRQRADVPAVQPHPAIVRRETCRIPD